MAIYTKLLQFDKETIQEIIDRDKTCIFCQMGYKMEGFDPNKLDCIIHDIAHFIPKSKMGLGIAKNGAFACRYHHHLLDNSKYRNEMLPLFENYLREIYPDWNKEELKYSKWKDLQYR